MRLDEACEPVFARHETFHPRWGWVKKGYDASTRTPGAFTADDATLQLGVGKNMVRAIRFWSLAAKATVERVDPDRPRMSLVHPSSAGHSVFAEDGFDPYSEDPGTLWLLHWLLLAPACSLPVWWAAFHEFGAVEFSEETLTAFVTEQVNAVSAWSAPHPSSIAKDVSCLLRTYAPSVSARQTFDDLVDCPMRELGLLRVVDPSKRAYRFAVGGKATLPADIVLFAALDFLARSDADSRTVTISRLATEPGSPGRAFKLSEADVIDLIERAAVDAEDVHLARPAGVTQLGFDDDADVVADRVLARFYARVRAGTIAGPVAGSATAAVFGADEFAIGGAR